MLTNLIRYYSTGSIDRQTGGHRTEMIALEIGATRHGLRVEFQFRSFHDGSSVLPIPDSILLTPSKETIMLTHADPSLAKLSKKFSDHLRANQPANAPSITQEQADEILRKSPYFDQLDDAGPDGRARFPLLPGRRLHGADRLVRQR